MAELKGYPSEGGVPVIGGGGGLPVDIPVYTTEASSDLTNETLLNSDNPLPIIKGGTGLKQHKSKKIRQYYTRPISTTTDGFGETGLSGSGSSFANADDADGTFLKFTSGAVSGNLAGYNWGFHICRISQALIGSFIIKTDTDLAASRYHIGYFSADPSGSDVPASSFIEFRYATTTDGTAFWRCVSSNGTSVETTVTTVAVATTSLYRMTVDCSTSGTVLFYINDQLVATHTQHLPSSGTTLRGAIILTTLAAAAKSIRIGGVTTENY